MAAHDGRAGAGFDRVGEVFRDPKTGQLTFGTQAIASVEPSTGAVRAMVGGPGFERYQFNLATHLPGRQPGSSMKTFVLATLFVRSVTFSSRS